MLVKLDIEMDEENFKKAKKFFKKTHKKEHSLFASICLRDLNNDKMKVVEGEVEEVRMEKKRLTVTRIESSELC